MTGIVKRLRMMTGDPWPQYADVPLYVEAADEIERLTLENWQLKGALGYPVPGDIPQGPFKCGLCEARALEPKP
jgi:hypothetical protein